MFTIVKPVPLVPDCELRVAEVVTRPGGIVQLPLAFVQYKNWIEPILGLPAGVVYANE